MIICLLVYLAAFPLFHNTYLSSFIHNFIAKMHFPDDNLYITIITPWGALLEYNLPSGPNRAHKTCNIPVFVGCPFKVYYAVGWAPTWKCPLVPNAPMYLCFELRVEGELVGGRFFVDQRNAEECSGFLPGGELGFYYPVLQEKKDNKNSIDGDLSTKLWKVEVRVYRCRVDVGRRFEPMVEGKKKEGKGLTEKKTSGPEGVIILNPNAILIAHGNWCYLDLDSKTTDPRSETRPIPPYSKGPKLNGSIMHEASPLPPQKILRVKNGFIARFDLREEVGCLSPLREVGLPINGAEVGRIFSRSLQQTEDPSQGVPRINPSLHNGTRKTIHWQVYIARDGQVRYCKKSTPNSTVVPKRRALKFVKYLPPGWEKRCIDGQTYFFDHNTGRTHREDPRIHTVEPLDPVPGIVSLHTIQEKNHEYRKKTGSVDTPPTGSCQEQLQFLLWRYGEVNASLRGYWESSQKVKDYIDRHENHQTINLPIVASPADAESDTYLASQRKAANETLEVINQTAEWLVNALNDSRNELEKLNKLLRLETSENGNGSGGKAGAFGDKGQEKPVEAE